MTHQSLLTQIFIHVGIIQQTNYTCNFYRLYNVCGPTVRKIKEVGLARKLVTIYSSHIFNYSFDAKEFSFNISQSYCYPHDSRIITPPSSCLQGPSCSQSAHHTHKTIKMVHTFAYQNMHVSSPLQSTTTFYKNFSWDIYFPCIQFPIILIPLAKTFPIHDINLQLQLPSQSHSS